MHTSADDCKWGEAEAAKLLSIARAAGEKILEIRADGYETKSKSDGTPVTRADTAAQEVILKGLLEMAPGIPVISEEKENSVEEMADGTYWCVDPLDGTRAFVDGSREFTVNIALMVGGLPCIGLLYAPMMDDATYGAPSGAWREFRGDRVGLRKQALALNPVGGGLRLVTSKREAAHLPLKEWLESGQIAAWKICSSAYKYELLARGDADLCVRTRKTREWDTAAGDAILRSLGGATVTADGKPLAYGKKDFENGAMMSGLEDALGSLFAQELRERLTSFD